MSEASTRCGFVAIIGAPNSGKSTLLNTLAGYKLAIVSHKVQTTRSRVRAIIVEGCSQIIFVDTPGIFLPRRRLDEAMVNSAWEGATDADVVLLMVDARTGLTEDVNRIAEKLKGSPSRQVLVLNKVDVVKRERLLVLAGELNELCPFEQTFMISASTGDGVDEMKRKLAEMMFGGPWLYSEDQLSDIPQRLIASEIICEKIYERLHQELPYASTVETEKWEERPDGSVRIEQVIFVERENQRKIVL